MKLPQCQNKHCKRKWQCSVFRTPSLDRYDRNPNTCKEFYPTETWNTDLYAAPIWVGLQILYSNGMIKRAVVLVNCREDPPVASGTFTTDSGMAFDCCAHPVAWRVTIDPREEKFKKWRGVECRVESVERKYPNPDKIMKKLSEAAKQHELTAPHEGASQLSFLDGARFAQAWMDVKEVLPEDLLTVYRPSEIEQVLARNASGKFMVVTRAYDVEKDQWVWHGTGLFCKGITHFRLIEL